MDRFYWDGKQWVPSGTTVLIQPELKQWAADCAVEYLCAIPLFGEGDLEAARDAYIVKSKQAMAYGTFIHWLCEQSLREMKPQAVLEKWPVPDEDWVLEVPVDMTMKFMHGFDYETKTGQKRHTKGFWGWVKDNKVEPIVLEQEVIGHGYGGRLDLVCKMNGVITLVDFKTGTGPYYNSWKYQLAGYRQAYNGSIPFTDVEMFKVNSVMAFAQEQIGRIQSHGILQFNKKTNKVNYKCFDEYQATRPKLEGKMVDGKVPTEKYTRTYETDRQTFNSLVNLWWLRKRGINLIERS